MRRAKSKAHKSIARTTTLPIKVPDSSGEGWLWIIDNRMADYGETDFELRVIRINRAMHRREGELLIDTLFHEELHRMFPYLSERAVRGMTKLLLPTLSPRYRAYLYSKLRNGTRRYKHRR